MNMNKVKRERQANFSSFEEKLLVDLILKHGHIIENKETDAEVWKKKGETWDKIDGLMVVSSGIQRGIKALKNKWEKIKRDVKLRLSEEKKEMYKTGGGVAKTFKKIEFYDNIVELLGISAVGLDSCFDSDIVAQEHNSSDNNLNILNMEVEIENVAEIFEDSQVGFIPISDVDNKEKSNNLNDLGSPKPSTSYETNWDSWTPTALRKPVSEALIVTKKKGIGGSTKGPLKRKTAQNDGKKKNEVYEKQLEMIEGEKERSMVRFEWERAEHEVRMEAFRLDIEIKKKTLLNMNKQ